jgi:hypothetical protein
MDQEDELRAVLAGGPVVGERGGKAVLVVSAKDVSFIFRTVVYLIFGKTPDPASSRRRNLGSTSALIVVSHIGVEFGLRLVSKVSGEKGEGILESGSVYQEVRTEFPKRGAAFCPCCYRS